MRMRCFGWQNMSKQKCIQSFVLLTSKQFCWQENAALFLRVKFLHLLGQTRFNAESSPSPFISSTVKSQILAKISTCFFKKFLKKWSGKQLFVPTFLIVLFKSGRGLLARRVRIKIQLGQSKQRKTRRDFLIGLTGGRDGSRGPGNS